MRAIIGRLNGLGIFTKLLIIFLMLAAVQLTVCVYAAVTISDNEVSYKRLMATDVAVNDLARRATFELVLLEKLAYQFVLIDDAKEIAARISEADQAQIDYLNDKNAIGVLSPDRRADLDQDIGAFHKLQSLIRSAETLARANDDKNATPLIDAKLAPALDDMIADAAKDSDVYRARLQSDGDSVAAETAARTRIMWVVAIAGVGCGALAGILMARFGISTPLSRMKSAMDTLANGDTDASVFGLDRKDEVGAMARSVQVFKDNMIQAARRQRDHDGERARTEAEKKAMLARTADQFEAGIGSLAEELSGASTQLQAAARVMRELLEKASSRTDLVVNDADNATTNVQTIAAATEEMSSSIGEIARQLTTGTQVAGQAVQDSNLVNVKMLALADTASKIGAVVRLIRDIASQTNLLALNATIEAARAGEAGKGFAVVASEVKALATQTQRATEEIAAQVEAIQGDTESAVLGMDTIGSTIAKIDETVTSIASAVEQQGAATREIARNADLAAVRTKDVSTTLASVRNMTGETGTAAEQVLSLAQSLTEQSTNLKTRVASFLREVRAA